MIYNLLLIKVKKIYLTRIHENFVGDAFFPKVRDEEWKIESSEKGIQDEENPYNYEYITYVRK